MPGSWHGSCRAGGQLTGGIWPAGAAVRHMNAFKLNQCASSRMVWMALAGWLVLPLLVLGAAEEKLDVLRTKTTVYTNVTITTKATNYLFIVHSAGMASIKVSDLTLETKQELGYAPKPGASTSTNAASAWAKRELAKINGPQVTAFKKQVEQQLRPESRAKMPLARWAGPALPFVVLGLFLLIYLFYCYCLMLICRKAGHPPGVLVWLPVLQTIPLLRAAGMSLWWLLAFLVPLLNLVPSILWPFKITKARGKSVWVAILLLLPITNIFAFLYLAFSSGIGAEEDEESEPKVMSLAAA